MAWESVFEGRFSHKSDAWALAVTLWELYSECREKPFQNLADSHVIQNLQSVIVNGILKEHLCRPTKCPMPIYTEIMLPCWRKEERERPTLSSIHLFLQSLQFSQLIPCPPPPNRSAPVPPL
uniref:Protein kinase domain-containing protein n=1 Tax=Panagrolaimus sp. JU765 TaxID=591449 RepID=A0AC34R5L9_9BILA